MNTNDLRFLFREHNVGQPKSKAATAMAQATCASPSEPMQGDEPGHEGPEHQEQQQVQLII